MLAVAIDEHVVAKFAGRAETATRVHVEPNAVTQESRHCDRGIGQTERKRKAARDRLSHHPLTIARREEGGDKRQRFHLIEDLLRGDFRNAVAEETLSFEIANAGAYGDRGATEAFLHIGQDRRAGSVDDDVCGHAIAPATAAQISSTRLNAISGWIGRLRSRSVRLSVRDRTPRLASENAG